MYSYFISRKNNYPKEGKVTLPGIWDKFKKSIFALLTPIIIIVGIRFGYFTATEGGAIVSAYTLFVSMVVYRDIKIKDLPRILYDAASSTAIISFIIAATSLFSWLLTLENIPQDISTYLLSLTENKILLLLIINLILLIFGMFLDSAPAILLLAPILSPVAADLGVDMVQFGLIMVVNLTIGLLTPPVGTALFVSSTVSGVPILKLSRKLIPFWLIMIFVLLLVTFIPTFTTVFAK